MVDEVGIEHAEDAFHRRVAKAIALRLMDSAMPGSCKVSRI